MSSFGLTYTLIVRSFKLYHFKICSNFHLYEEEKSHEEFVSPLKKNNTPPKQTQTLLFYQLQIHEPYTLNLFFLKKRLHIVLA